MTSATLFVLLVAVGSVGESASNKHTNIHSYFTCKFKSLYVTCVNSNIHYSRIFWASP